MDPLIGVITDIVRSRAAPDRSAAQSAVRDAFAAAHDVVPPATDLWATAGDEFQVVYADIAAALAATTLVRAALPDGVDCRFGIGEGEIREVETAVTGHAIQDGSAWWNARAAIEKVHGMQKHGHPALRTWFHADDPDRAAQINAFLVSRDHIVSRMKSRERRLASSYLAGRAQADIARDEKISQPAVSQNLARSGAADLALALDVLAQRA